MSTYTKLFSSIIDSTVWRESKETKIVWITMLAKSDKGGVVEASLPGLADAAKVSLDECIAALRVLSSPDEYSRTKTHDGRRIAEIDGGWQILNHGKYRDKMGKEERAEYQRNWMQEHRKRKKEVVTEGKVAGAQQAIKEGFEQGIPQPENSASIAAGKNLSAGDSGLKVTRAFEE